MMIRLLIALLLFAAVPVMAAEDKAPAAPQLAQQQVRDALFEQLQMQANEAEARAAEAERRERDAEIKRLADQARQAQAGLGQAEQRAREAEIRQFVLQEISERENKAYARLEIIVSVSIGFFASLITVLVVFFALRTEKSAIAAAKAGVEAELGEWRQEAELLLNKMKVHESEADRIVKKLAPGEAPESEEDRKVVADAALVALAKPIRERGADDYRVIISYHAGTEDWEAMLKAAKEMQLLFSEKSEDLALALGAEGFALGQLGRPENAISAWDDVIARFGASKEPALQERVAKALVNKGITLGQLNRSEEAIAVYDDVIKRFGDSKEPALQEQVGKALVSKGITLGQLNRSEEAIAVYDDVIKRFGDSKELALQEQVAMALVNKGIRLGQLQQWEKAIAACDDIITRFEDSKEPELREILGRARKLKAQIQENQKK